MSSHTLVHPATPPVFIFLPLSHPCDPSTSIHPHPSPTLSAPPLPVFHPSPPSSTVWTGSRELWPFFHPPPAGADPSWRGSDSEPGPGRVPGILLYQPAVPGERGLHYCHRAGLTLAHARTHRYSPRTFSTHALISLDISRTKPALNWHKYTRLFTLLQHLLSWELHVAFQCNSIYIFFLHTSALEFLSLRSIKLS